MDDKELVQVIKKEVCRHISPGALCLASNLNTGNEVAERLARSILALLRPHMGGGALFALDNLVRLKKHKEGHGKDAFYLARRTNAWKLAEDVLLKAGDGRQCRFCGKASAPGHEDACGHNPYVPSKEG